MKAIIQDEPINKLEKFISMNRRYRSHLMRRRHWFTDISSSGISSTARLPRLSLPAMKLIGSMRMGRRPLQSFARAEKCKGIGAVANVDVFEAITLDWYLKLRSEEVDASGHAKGNHN